MSSRFSTFALFIALLIFYYLLFFCKFQSDFGINEKLSGLTEPEILKNKKIGGKNRFQWHRDHWGKDVRIANKSTRPVSMLYAYEFDHEISVSLSNWDLKGYKVFCRYQDSSGNELFPVFESLTYPEYQIHCEKRKNAHRIGITYTKWEHFSSIPIIKTATKKYQLSMCLTPFYGSEPKWLLLSEMLEHYKLQGVEHFYLYIHQISLYDLKLIADYQRTGEIEVFYLLERDERPGDQEWQVVHIADCHLRAKMESEWTIFADLDERIVMNRGNLTISEYLRRNISEDKSIGAVRFRQQWVLKTETMPEEYEDREQLISWLPTLRWHNSTGFGPIGHTAKNIIRPETVFIMWVHDIWAFFPDNYHIKEVETDIGNVRHYRDQQLGDWGKRWLKDSLKFGALRATDYPNPFLLKKITDNVIKRIDYVYGVKDD